MDAEKKDKIIKAVVGIFAVAIAVLIILMSYKLIFKKKSGVIKNVENKKEITEMAKENTIDRKIVTFKDNKMYVYNRQGEKIADKKMGKTTINRVFKSKEDPDVFYGYDIEAKDLIKVTVKNKKIDVDILTNTATDKRAEVKDVIEAGDKIYLALGDGGVYEYSNKKSSLVVKDKADKIAFSENKLIYSDDNNITIYNPKAKSKSVINITEPTIGLITQDKKVYAVNKFGNRLQNSLIVEIDAKKEEVTGLEEFKGVAESIYEYGKHPYIELKDKIIEYDFKDNKNIKVIPKELEKEKVLLAGNQLITKEKDLIKIHTVNKSDGVIFKAKGRILTVL